MNQCKDDFIHIEAVELAQNHALSTDQIQKISQIYKAIAEPTRLKILWALTQTELCVCDIASVLSMSKSAISHQLRYLKEINLVKNRKTGRNVFYSLADQHVSDLLEITLEHSQEDES